MQNALDTSGRACVASRQGGSHEGSCHPARAPVHRRARAPRSRRARKVGQGRLPDVLRCQGPGRLRARRGPAALLLVRGSAQGLRGRPPARSGLCDGLLGAGRQLSRQFAGVGPATEGRRRRGAGARQGARDRGQDPARTRLDRGHRRLLPRRRQGAGARAPRRLHEGHGTDDAAPPRRLRGVGVLRAHPAGLGAPDRQDLRAPAQIGGDPGAPGQEEPPSTRGRRTT